MEQSEFNVVQMQSPPVRWRGLKRGEACHQYPSHGSSPPVRWRGLKQDREQDTATYRLSPPVRWRGLKREYLDDPGRHDVVATRAVAWIETPLVAVSLSLM